MRSENPHCDMGVVPPSVASAFRTQVGVESSLVCHGQYTVWELVVVWRADERRSRVFSWG